jgi:hypothetical protein
VAATTARVGRRLSRLSGGGGSGGVRRTGRPSPLHEQHAGDQHGQGRRAGEGERGAAGRVGGRRRLAGRGDPVASGAVAAVLGGGGGLAGAGDLRLLAAGVAGAGSVGGAVARGRPVGAPGSSSSSRTRSVTSRSMRSSDRPARAGR